MLKAVFPTSNVQSPTSRGFTLVELLVVMAIVAIITGLSFPVYKKLLFKSSVDLVRENITQSVRRAQLLSMSGEYDSAYGIYLDTESLTLFQGNSFEDRNPAYDEVSKFSSNIAIVGDNEITFEKFTGKLDSSKQITLNMVNEQVIVTINQKGVVD